MRRHAFILFMAVFMIALGVGEKAKCEEPSEVLNVAEKEKNMNDQKGIRDKAKEDYDKKQDEYDKKKKERDDQEKEYQEAQRTFDALNTSSDEDSKKKAAAAKTKVNAEKKKFEDLDNDSKTKSIARDTALIAYKNAERDLYKKEIEYHQAKASAEVAQKDLIVAKAKKEIAETKLTNAKGEPKITEAKIELAAAEADYERARLDIIKKGLVQQPSITAITPEQPSADGLLIIKGKDFGSGLDRESKVELVGEGKECESKDCAREMKIESWTDTEIHARPRDSFDASKQKIRVTSAEKANAESIINLQPFRNDRKYFVDFLTGVEYTQQSKDGEKDFASKPYAEINGNAKIVLKDALRFGIPYSGREVSLFDGIWRSTTAVRLNSVTLQGQSSSGTPVANSTRAEQSLDFNWSLSHSPDWWVFPKLWDQGIETSIFVKVGGYTAKRSPGIGSSSEGVDFIFKDSVGLRFLVTGRVVNGAYVDFGWGRSDNFTGNKHRGKIEAFLPLDFFGYDTFLKANFETDFTGENPDSASYIVGVRVKPEKVLDFIKK